MHEVVAGCSVLAFATPAHALGHPVAPEPLAELTASVLASLIRMEHDFFWSTTLFPGVIQSFYNQIGIRTGGHDPANNPASVQIQHDRQIAPPLATPDVGDITTPDLVGLV